MVLSTRVRRNDDAMKYFSPDNKKMRLYSNAIRHGGQAATMPNE